MRTAASSRSTLRQAAFVAGAFALFYLIVYGIPLSTPTIVIARSAALLLFSFVVLRIGNSIGFASTGFVDRSLRGMTALQWGVVCYIANVAVAAIVYMIDPALVTTGNRNFYSPNIELQPVYLKVLMSVAAGISEEALYRFALFKFLLGIRFPTRIVRYLLAFSISSLMFGFGHFHAGVIKCLIATGGGLVFAAFYLWKKDLRVVMFAHAFGDAIGIVLHR